VPFLSFKQRFLFKQRTFKSLLIAAVSLAIAFGFLIVPLERAQPNAKIHNLGDGMWWALQTLTTVGYGDTVPVTTLGRLLALVLLLMGTVMFGSLIAMISSSMSRSQEEFYWNRLFERLDRMEKEIDELKKQSMYFLKDDVHNNE
jgi:voltage-gated potassium channel